VSFCLAVATTFTLNRVWAYKESRSKNVHSQVVQFLLISLVGLVINLVVFGAVDRFLHARVGSALALYSAQACAVGTALIWNFIANRFITYGDVKLGE
jgi:putative flippase GtrA